MMSGILQADIELPLLPKSADKIFVGITENRQKLLETVKHERERTEKAREEQASVLHSLIEELRYPLLYIPS